MNLNPSGDCQIISILPQAVFHISELKSSSELLMDLFAYSEKEMLIVLGVELKRDKKLFTQFFKIIVRGRTGGSTILQDNFGFSSSLLSVSGERKISLCQRKALTSDLHTYTPFLPQHAWCAVSHIYQIAPALFCIIAFLKPLPLCFLISNTRLQNIVSYAKDSSSLSFIKNIPGMTDPVLIFRHLHYFTLKT